MGLLPVEIVFAFLALKRGWRFAPALLLALPITVLAFESNVAGWLAPLAGLHFEPAATARALAHGASLLGLAIACWTGPAEKPVRAPLAARRRPRTGSLYTI